MNKKELVQNIAKKYNLPISKTGDIVSSILETITKSLTKGDGVVFVGFGSFSLKKRNPRLGRNPQTGETIKISARKVVRFSAGTGLKKTINKK